MTKKQKLTLLKGGGPENQKPLTPQTASDSLSPEEILEHQLEVFQKRYMESQHHISVLERGLHLLLTQKHISPKSLQEIQLKLEAIGNRQKSWIQQLTEIINKEKKKKIQKRIDSG
jgi:hypothetical protein